MLKTTKIIAFIVLIISIASCASAPTQQEAEIAHQIEQLLVREMASLPKTKKYINKDAGFKTSVPYTGEMQFKESKEGQYFQLSFNVSKDLPITCFAYKEKIIDTGGAISRVNETLAAGMNAKLSSSMGFKTGVYKGNPYMQLEQMYIADNNGQKLPIHLKTAVAQQENSTLACVTYVMGYPKTFTKVVKLFSKYTKIDGLDPVYDRKVSLIKTKGKAIGFLDRTVFKGKNNDMYESVATSFAVQAQNQIYLSDVLSNLQFYHGAIVEADYVQQMNGKSIVKSNLKWTANKKYKITGVRAGEAFSNEVKSELPYIAGYSQDMVFKDYYNKKTDKPMYYNAYVPAKVVDNFMKIELSVKDRKKRILQNKSESLVTDIKLNKAGVPVAIISENPIFPMTIKQVHWKLGGKTRHTASKP